MKRAADGSYAFIYFPQAGQSLTVDLRPLTGKVKAAWFDPRTGCYYPVGEHAARLAVFTSPLAGPDWGLVLDRLLM